MDALSILRSTGLSHTRNRINILKTLDGADAPLSGKEICMMLEEKCDKSTVHRTLNSLYEKNILQRIIIDHEVKFALDATLESGSGHKGDHLHFKCSKCERLFCLKEVIVNDYDLPDGFIPEENQFLVIGRCKECQ